MTTSDLVGIFVVGTMFLSTVSFVCGSLCEGARWKEMCIDRGYGRYNPKTGNWEWVDDADAARASGQQGDKP